MAKTATIEKHTRRGWTDIREYLDPTVLREAERSWPDNSGIPAADSASAILAALNDSLSGAYYEKKLDLAGLSLGASSSIKPNTNYDSYVISGGDGCHYSNGSIFATGTTYTPSSRVQGGYSRALLVLDSHNHAQLKSVNFRTLNVHVGAVDVSNCNWIRIEDCLIERSLATIRQDELPTRTSLTSTGMSGDWGSSTPVGTRVEIWVSIGATLPTGYSANTPYYISATSGNNRAISATLGGSTIVPTTTGSGHWGYIIGAPSVQAVNTGTKTITIENHGFTDGQRIACYNPATVWTDFLQTSIPFGWGYCKYVDANSFQVSATPGGAAITLNAFVAGARVTLYAPAVNGGGNQFGRFTGNLVRETTFGVELSTAEVPNGVYVGFDTVTFSDNYYHNSSVGISGRGNILNDRWEGIYPQAALTVGADTSVINIIGAYMELAVGASPCLGITLVNYQGTITGCQLTGSDTNDGDSAGILVARPGSQAIPNVFGNCIADFVYAGRAFTSFGAPEGATKRPFNWGPNETHRCTNEYAGWGTQQLNGADAHIKNFDIYRMNIGRETSHPTFNVPTRIGGNVSGDSNHTTFDVGWGSNVVVSNSSQTKIDDIAANYYGYNGIIVSENANLVLGIGAFKTLSGADYYPLTNEVNRVSTAIDNGNATTSTWKRLLLEQAFGSVVARVQPGAQTGNYSPTLFTGTSLTNINTGLYSIEGQVSFNTAGSAGTWKITLGWTAPTIGSQTRDLTGEVAATLAQSWSATTTQIVTFRVFYFSVASGIPTLALAFTGLTGTPSFVPEFTIRKHS